MSDIAYWNYRVVRTTTTDGAGFEIAEVYYDATDRYVGWCMPKPGSDIDETDLRGDLELMLKAFDRPTIDREDLERMGREESEERIRDGQG